MIVLGLGSNVGDRLQHLRHALTAIKQLDNVTIKQVSPVYLSDALLPENAPPEWDMPHLNLAICIETSLQPLTLLDALKHIEWSIGRKPEAPHWGPRILDIDILTWNNEIIISERLTVPHANLIDRPFALWPLADVAPFWQFPLEGIYHDKTAQEIAAKWGSRFTGDAPLKTKQIYQRIDSPQLVGALNITPDSFSDGGVYTHAEQALHHALRLVETGAEIIDIGAEATSPAALAIDAETEWRRLSPVIEIITQHYSQFLVPPKISVDTRHVSVAKRALTFPINWINDVSGFTNPEMRELLSSRTQDCVVMHSVTVPASAHSQLPPTQSVVTFMVNWFKQQLEILEQSNINLDRIILDPGIGFGKNFAASFELIKHVEVFKQFNTRLLIGHSRKLFLNLFTDKQFAERDIETAAIAMYLANQNIDYIRVHNTEMCARVFRIMQALKK